MAETAVELIQEGKDITTHLTDTEKFNLDRCERIIRDGLNTFLHVGSALAQIRDNRLYRETHKTFEKYCKEVWDLSKGYATKQICGYQTITLLESKMVAIATKNESKCNQLVTKSKDKMVPIGTVSDSEQSDQDDICHKCPERKGMNNRKFKGVKIPGVGRGKCIREGGLCEKKMAPIGAKKMSAIADKKIILPINEAQTRPLTKLNPDDQVKAWGLVLEELSNDPKKKLTAALINKVVKQVKGETVTKKIKTTRKKIERTELVSNYFKKQYQALLDAITEERNNGWQTTSKKEAVRWLNNMIEVIKSDD